MSPSITTVLRQSTTVVRMVWNHPENRHRRLRAVVTLVTWQVWERTIRRPWTITLHDGVRLRVYPHNASASYVLYCGLGETRDMRLTLSYLRSDDLFVDVGANVGVYSLLAASIPGVSVESFEPSNEAYGHLLENVALNRFDARVTTHEAAAGAHDGSGWLIDGEDVYNRLTTSDDPAAVAVDVVTLDRVLGDDRRRVALIKIDVEGFEADVLRGAAAVLRRDAPAIIVEGPWEAVAAVVEPLGYRAYDYDPAARVLCATTQLVGSNSLLLADADEACRRLGARVVERTDAVDS